MKRIQQKKKKPQDTPDSTYTYYGHFDEEEADATRINNDKSKIIKKIT